MASSKTVCVELTRDVNATDIGNGVVSLYGPGVGTPGDDGVVQLTGSNLVIDDSAGVVGIIQ